MGEYRIAVLIGSLRRESYNRQLANAVQKLGPPDFSFYDLRIDDLPLYNQDDESSPADPVKRLKSDIASAHGLMFVTPEYNRSIPGVLKNAIDHASRPYGESAWNGKPAGIMGASVGAPGTSMAQQHLRNILRTWMFRRLASRKYLSKLRSASSTRMAALQTATPRSFCRAG